VIYKAADVIGGHPADNIRSFMKGSRDRARRFGTPWHGDGTDARIGSCSSNRDSVEIWRSRIEAINA
jgi:hypothetical protein